MPDRPSPRRSNLVLVERATHEPVVTGDFVRLASGSPLGLVNDVDGETAWVTWLTSPAQRSVLPWVCLRPLSQRREMEPSRT